MEQINETSLLVDRAGGIVTQQAILGENVTPSDSTILENGCLYVGTGGNIKVRLVGGSVLTFSNVTDGSFLPIVVNMVYSTDTTASDIIILR